VVIAPVQVLVIGVDSPTYSGALLSLLAGLRDAGIVRLIDVLVVSRDAAGALHTLPPPDGLPADVGEIAAAVLGEPPESAKAGSAVPGAVTAGTAWSLAEAVPVGTTAVVALIEHLWAGPLRDAIDRAGGNPLDETWLAAEDLERLESLMAHHSRA